MMMNGGTIVASRITTQRFTWPGLSGFSGWTSAHARPAEWAALAEAAPDGLPREMTVRFVLELR